MTIKTAADAEYADDLGKIFSGSVYSGQSRRYPGGLGMDRRVEALDFSPGINAIRRIGLLAPVLLLGLENQNPKSIVRTPRPLWF